MSRVVVLGAGVAGHTAASFARKWLSKEHTVTVVSPRDFYNWIPSNIWVGVGLMKPEKVTFPLQPIYDRAGIEFVHAAAREIHPEGGVEDSSPFFVDARNDPTQPQFGQLTARTRNAISTT
jgi:sulfide:quinone oxidoreductase